MLQQIINGVVLGGTYSLIALGFTLIIGVLSMLNLAIGETLMVAGFAGLILMTVVGLPFVLALLAAILVGALISLATYFLSFRYVDEEFFAAPVLSTIGVGVVLTSVATKIFGSENRSFPDVVPVRTYELLGARIRLDQLLILSIAILLMVGLHRFVNGTKMGLAIRAVSERPGTAALVGVPVDRVIITTFLASGAIVGAAGVLTGVLFHTINPFIGFNATLKGLAIMVIGGLGSVRGAVVAGFGIAVIEILSVAYVSATFRNALAFLILILVLVIRPEGLMGRRLEAKV